jgi:hypothetical protein
MNNELPPNRVERSEVVEILKSTGWDNPEARGLFFRWVAQEEKILDQVPGGESRDSLNVVLLIEQGKLLEKASIKKKADEMFDYAFLIAQNIGSEDLYHRTMSQSTDSVM